MKIFYDTEFHENGHSIDLISIGMVAEDGKTLYYVSWNFDFQRAWGNEWLRENVLPHLPTEDYAFNECHKHLNPESPFVMEKWDIAAQVRTFIQSYGNDVELWAYYAAYDHVALAQLFGKMIDLPRGIPMYTHDIKQEMDRLGVKKSDLPLELQVEANHKAIDDAQWNMKVMQFLETYTYGTKDD